MNVGIVNHSKHKVKNAFSKKKKKKNLKRQMSFGHIGSINLCSLATRIESKLFYANTMMMTRERN